MPLPTYSKVKEGERNKIVFVCTGNTCRSPMAQVFFEHCIRDIPEFTQYAITSAGLNAHEGQKSPLEIQTLIEAREFSLSNHQARLLTQSVVDEAVTIICATSAHEKFLKDHFINLPKICTSFAEFGGDIADPYGGDMKNYGRIADEIKQKLSSIIKFLRRRFNDH